MLRFLALALPAALLVLAFAGWAAESLGGAPDHGPLAALFEATALVAFYLLVEGRTGSPVADGVVAGLAAWLFRGPLLVVAVAALTRLPTDPFWQSARIWLVALPAAGAAVGAVARWTRPPSGPRAPA